MLVFCWLKICVSMNPQGPDDQLLWMNPALLTAAKPSLIVEWLMNWLWFWVTPCTVHLQPESELHNCSPVDSGTRPCWRHYALHSEINLTGTFTYLQCSESAEPILVTIFWPSGPVWFQFAFLSHFRPWMQTKKVRENPYRDHSA